MSLRSLGYLLTRRFYPRKMYRVQAESSPGIVSQPQAASVSAAAGRPGRSLHTLRDLRAGDNAFGAVYLAAALAGGLGLGILIFKKHHPHDAGSKVTNEDTKEAASRKTEVTDNKPMQVEVTDMEEKREEARFREWVKRMGKVYPNQEEERKRFEIFKKNMKKMDAVCEKSSVRHLSKTPWADLTVMEMRREEEKALTRLMKERAQKLIEEGKLNKHYRYSIFPEEQEREQKMKEEGSLHNCSKQ